MKRSEWAELVAVMRVEWPHASLSDETIAAWYQHVAELEVSQAADAIASLARSGREFPPTGGMIRQRADEMGRGAIEAGAAYALAMEAASSRGGFNRGLDWLKEQDALAALAAHRYGWRDFCYSEAEDTTRRAQFLRIYEGCVRERARADAHRELASSPEPKQIGSAVAGLVEGMKP